MAGSRQVLKPMFVVVFSLGGWRRTQTNRTEPHRTHLDALVVDPHQLSKALLAELSCCLTRFRFEPTKERASAVDASSVFFFKETPPK